jgi:hypothetical protein
VKYEDQTLLSQARQSTKKELAARRKTHRERLRAFWADSFDLLDEYARESIPDQYEGTGVFGKVFNHETALANVRKKLCRCKAQTREGFISWATRQIAKQPGFHLVAGAIKRFDLGVSSYIDTAKLRHERYLDFEYAKDGDLYRVNLGTDQAPIPWTIPAQYWQFAQNVWPVFAKRKPDGGFYVAKKIGGVTVPLHRIFLNCGPGDTVESSSGNHLDWTSLYVRPFNRSGIYEGRNTSWNKEEKRPNTVQEEFERRFRDTTVLETYGTNIDGTRFVLPSPVPVNNDLAATATLWGKVVSTGMADPTRSERDQQYAPERYPRRPSDRMQAAATALDALGL